MVGVALGDIDAQSAWQARRLWRWAGSGGALGSRVSPWTPRLFVWQARGTWSCLSPCTLRLLCGRRGTWQHPVSFGVAGVALGDIDLHFLWQAWRLVTSTFVAGMALGVHSARQPWDLWRRAGSGGTLGSPCRRGCRGCLCGTRGTWRHPVSFGVAGVALGFIEVQSVWQPWHLALARGRRGCLCGRHGTWRHPVSFGVARVALGDIDIHFVWQASDLATSTVTLHGRCGT